MQHRLIHRINVFFASEWRIMAYQPVLYFFVWGASIRLWINKTEPPNFDVISHDFYWVWLHLGVLGPPLALLSWYLITKRSGRWRFRGMWFRLAADAMVFTNLLTFHLVAVMTRNENVSEAKMYSRYVFGSAMLFCLLFVVRDLWALYLTERLASRIHSGTDSE